MERPTDMEVPLQVQDISSIPSWLRFIPVNNTLSPTYHEDPDAKTGKAHLLVFLSMRHNSKKKDLVYYRGRGEERKKERKNYDRIVFFADTLCSNAGGAVCAKVLETSGESMSFFKNVMHGQYGIGHLYLMEE
jgi:hypothetical protein